MYIDFSELTKEEFEIALDIIFWNLPEITFEK